MHHEVTPVCILGTDSKKKKKKNPQQDVMILQKDLKTPTNLQLTEEHMLSGICLSPCLYLALTCSLGDLITSLVVSVGLRAKS